jgi:hypothetical protein
VFLVLPFPRRNGCILVHDRWVLYRYWGMGLNAPIFFFFFFSFLSLSSLLLFPCGKICIFEICILILVFPSWLHVHVQKCPYPRLCKCRRPEPFCMGRCVHATCMRAETYPNSIYYLLMHDPEVSCWVSTKLDVAPSLPSPLI